MSLPRRHEAQVVWWVPPHSTLKSPRPVPFPGVPGVPHVPELRSLPVVRGTKNCPTNSQSPVSNSQPLRSHPLPCFTHPERVAKGAGPNLDATGLWCKFTFDSQVIFLTCVVCNLGVVGAFVLLHFIARWAEWRRPTILQSLGCLFTRGATPGDFLISYPMKIKLRHHLPDEKLHSTW
jgi:hypothetical protein